MGPRGKLQATGNLREALPELCFTQDKAKRGKDQLAQGPGIVPPSPNNYQHVKDNLFSTVDSDELHCPWIGLLA